MLQSMYKLLNFRSKQAIFLGRQFLEATESKIKISAYR